MSQDLQEGGLVDSALSLNQAGTSLSRKEIIENLELVNQQLSEKNPEAGCDGRHEHYLQN